MLAKSSQWSGTYGASGLREGADYAQLLLRGKASSCSRPFPSGWAMWSTAAQSATAEQRCDQTLVIAQAVHPEVSYSNSHRVLHSLMAFLHTLGSLARHVRSCL